MRIAIHAVTVLTIGILSFYFGNIYQSNIKGQEKMSTSSNPVVYFEIPVKDINRAKKFYSAVFDFKFTDDVIDGNEMALFPFTEGTPGITGALAKGSIYKPSKSGTLVYFSTEDIDATLLKANQNGAKTLYPKTSIGDLGFVAEFEDSEGNRIALHSQKKSR